jgi:endonuclease-3 related protein
MESVFINMYDRLLKEFGPQGWWPGESIFEIIIGAILTQNTAWGNVEKAINNLQQHDLLTPAKLYQIPEQALARWIRPAGYFNIKAKRIRNFLRFLFSQHQGDLLQLGELKLSVLREKLLTVNGIGPETADSILLYAFGKPIFVVDAYTRRIFSRHKFISEKTSYSEIQRLFMTNLPQDVDLLNEFHALIVHLGKNFCRRKPRCGQCPLKAKVYFRP